MTPLDVALAFAGVPFAVVYSQNHLKAKGEKCARPRFHVFFPIEPISDPVKYAELKRRIAAAFPYFDNAALDSARFLYGVENPVAEMYDGDTLITDYLEGMEFAEWDASTKDVTGRKAQQHYESYCRKTHQTLWRYRQGERTIPESC